MRMAAPGFYTAEMVRALPDDGNRYETVYGELLVTPAPRARHQEAISRLQVALTLYLREHRAGHLFASPADISWSEDTLVQPDLFVVALDEARTMDWRRMQTLLLAIEVLSPSSIRADRFTKRRLYQQVGIGLYWVVDADAESVEIWTPDHTFPTAAMDELVWAPAGFPPFRMSLAELFQPI
jgi:Uma2 family endonuclease